MADKKLVPNCCVYIEGSKLPPYADANLIDIMVCEDLDKADMCMVRLSNEGFLWSDGDLFKEGKKIKIDLGYNEDLKTLFEGEITSRECSFPSKGPSVLAVIGYDKEHRLKRGRKTRSFLKMKDSDIVNQIVGEADLSGEVDPTSDTHEYTFQNNITNLEFIKWLARRNGYEVDVSSQKLRFRKPKYETSETVTLKWGDKDGLKAFRPRLSTDQQVTEVIVRGWDPRKKKEIVGKAKKAEIYHKMGCKSYGLDKTQKGFGEIQEFIVSQPIFTEQEAKSIAKNWLNKYAYHYIMGFGSCSGNNKLRAGEVVKIDNVGKRFGGKYYIHAIRHMWESEGYVTHFMIQRCSEEVSAPPPPKPKPKAPVQQPPPPKPKKTSFQVTVQGPAGQAYEGMEVLFFQQGQSPQKQSLDGSGKIRRDNIDPGAFTVEIKDIKDADWDV
jgi:phage protein D